tara:strand:+ start:12156 stop:13487 length:1332 start_codon:yes stop_codon:yes gene_type:complete
MMFKTALLSTILLGAIACESSKPAGNEAPTTPTEPVAQTEPVTEKPTEQPVAETGTPTEPGDPAPLADASNALAFDLYKTQLGETGNLAFSPASISLAFAMTYAGANGPTAAQMKKVLHLPDDEALQASAAGLIASWNSAKADYELKVVNRLFGQADYKFEQPFLDVTKNTYQAPLESLDFKKGAEAQRLYINNWVLEQTEKRIANLLPKNSITDDTRLVLTNAVYFLGKWKSAFKKESTQDRPFFANGKDKADVPTMQQTGQFGYASTLDVKLLRMPYRGDDLSMTIVLPNAKDGLSKIEKSLDLATYKDWSEELGAQTQKVKVLLPSFEIADAALPLADALKTLGMTMAFDPGAADFTKMANPANGAEQLYISGAFHKAFVKVDESGTEAAAATAVVMGAKGAARPAPAPPTFLADHPFLFTIEDSKSGAILFVGRVVDPR